MSKDESHIASPKLVGQQVSRIRLHTLLWKNAAFLPAWNKEDMNKSESHIASPKLLDKNGQHFPLCYIASFKNQIAHPNVLKKGSISIAWNKEEMNNNASHIASPTLLSKTGSISPGFP